MRDLAERVGLRPSSFYSHIKSKEEILQKICFDNAHRFLAGIEEIESTEHTPEAQVRALIYLHIQIAAEDQTSITVFNDEWKHLSEPHLSDFLALRKSYEARFRQVIERGIAAKVFVDMSATVAMYTILSSVRWIHGWYRPDRKIELEQVKKDTADLLLGGLLR